MNEFKLDVRVYEFAEGGFIVTEIDATGEHSSPRAVSTLTDALRNAIEVATSGNYIDDSRSH